MTTVQLVEHVLMSVLLRQSLKVIFMLLILIYALTVELVPMFVQQKPSIRSRHGLIEKMNFGTVADLQRFFLFPEAYLGL